MFGHVHDHHGTQGFAILAIGSISITGVVLWAPFTGVANYYGDVGTIGTFALILVYIGVTIAEAIDAPLERKVLWAAFGLAGMLILVWPFYNSVYPAPACPQDLWTYLVIACLATGLGLLAMRPAMAQMGWRAPEQEFSWPDIRGKEGHLL